MARKPRPRRPRCLGYGMHWFAYYGFVGSSSPTCVRFGCTFPNPNYDPDRDIPYDMRHPG